MLNIDHVTIAGPRLEPMQAALAAIGLATDYGGPHSNGLTHMALLGFNDGSYIELISSLRPGQVDSTFWGQHIMGNGGPCAWAARVDDAAIEAARMAALGITVTEPTDFHRQRPDGVLVEWKLAFLGDKGAGATLPFIIEDITPRERRVRPSASVASGLLTGIARVILGVKNMEAAINLFRRAYSWPAPTIVEEVSFGARLAHFHNTPVILAEPLSVDNWLATRLTYFDDSPCAYLIGTSHFERARASFLLSEGREWFDRRATWFDPAKLNGTRLGIIDL